MSTDVAERARPGSSRAPTVGGLVGLPVLRVALVGLAALATWFALVAAGEQAPFPPGMLFAAATMLPVNVLSIILVRRALHRSGQRARDLIDFSWRRLGRDVLWGLLWLAVMWLPFILAVMAVMFALHGGSALEHFDRVFYDADAAPPVNRVGLTVLAIVSVVSFAPLNAPAEELIYRGYSQWGLERRWPPFWAMVVPAAIFALQHVFYAATADAVLVYLAAFFVWGIGSALIVHRQRRLMPIIIAHLLVNLMTSAPALVLLFLPDAAFAT
ncbi:CPBP family intramembrane glutamic endopeptidase [Agromyces subbeticus]|uniref:CPBP family intramembrane glutamic endopeptidase n=1 Tax=Agromyces subbeticus TaxID=293890 RepID=UPI0003B45269|nr:type II CAAX endopeptidase family protein [Agromyces subbeticus]